MTDDSGDDYAHDQVMSYPTDGYVCLACGQRVVSFPEGLFHAEEWRDEDHAPVVAT